MQLERHCQLPASDRERSVVVLNMACFIPLPLISPPLCLCCFPQSEPMRAAFGLSAAVSFREGPTMWEDVCWRLCLSRWVRTLFLLSLRVQWWCQKDDCVHVKVLQSPLGPVSSSRSLCLCWWSHWIKTSCKMRLLTGKPQQTSTVVLPFCEDQCNLYTKMRIHLSQM